MAIKRYVGALADARKGAVLLMCEYCGAETPSIGDSCFCSNCESIVTSDRAALAMKDHVLADSLDRINKSFASFDFEGAVGTYESLLKERKEPQLMYAAAIAYLRYSNHEISEIGYMNTGFMEANTAHRDRAALLASTAKKWLAKSVSTANSEIAAGARSPAMQYAKFLSHMKMQNMRAASEALKELKGMGNEYIYRYAAMVLDSGVQEFGNLLKDSEALMARGMFSVNAFYYAALALFKKNRPKDARELLASLNGVIKSGNMDALLLEINYQLGTFSGRV